MSVLPEDVMQKIAESFTTKASRAVAFELMTGWNRLPTWKEKAEIGARHSRSDRTVHGVIQKLQELELFTEGEGSIPLLRLSLRRQALTAPEPSEDDSNDVEDVNTPERVVTSMQLPEVSPAGYPLTDDVDDEPSSPQSVSEEDFNRLQKDFQIMQSKFDKLSQNLEAVVPIIKGLSAKVPGNPGLNPAPVETPEAGVPGPVNPFSGMSGEQVYEMYLNQPDQFGKLLGTPVPADSVAEGNLSALPATVRRMIVELTTYTQMSYEKAVNDGAIDGSLSDFLNKCVYSYFADRGIALEWHTRSLQPRRYG